MLGVNADDLSNIRSANCGPIEALVPGHTPPAPPGNIRSANCGPIEAP